MEFYFLDNADAELYASRAYGSIDLIGVSYSALPLNSQGIFAVVAGTTNLELVQMTFKSILRRLI